MSEGDATNSAKPELRIGSYRLLHSLGSGGMSSVFKAVHIESGHEVALKVLPRTLAKSSSLLQRFLREAKSAEALQHPNIVSIYDRGVDNGRHYLVLEFVEGGDLHDRVKNRGPLPVPEAIAVILKVAEGLQFASSRGLIHRDIKPANLLVTPEGAVKIIDLGLALQADEDDERVTREGTTVGTVDFMSPEQARDSRATNERSDIYSLGCTFYYLLSGTPPFPGGDVADKLSRHCLQPAPDVRQVRPDVPAALALLILRMMAKKPEQRFSNYQELIESLAAVPTSETSAAPASEPIYALFDDEDGSEVEAREPMPGGALYAIVDDEDPTPSSKADSLPQLDLTELAPLSGELPTEKRRPAAQVSLAELAELSGEDSDGPSARRPNVSPARSKRVEPASSPEAPNLSVLIEEEEVVEGLSGATSFANSRKYDDGTRKWITKWSLVGLGVICLVIGVHQLVRTATNSSEAVPEVVESNEASLQPTEVFEEPSPPPKPPAPETAPPEIVSVPKNALAATLKGATDPKTIPALVWKEPSDPKREILPEPQFASEQDPRILPEWAKAPVPDSLPGPFATVRRVTDPKDSAQYPTLRLGFDVIGGTLEIADNGPFFEDDFRIAGESRLIRAKAGFRPIICIDAPEKPIVRDQPAVFVLDGRNLILDGIDLFVDAKRLPRNQSALFLCRGGSLTLRNCTVTVLNARGLPFSVVRTGDPIRPSKLRFETTLVRGGPFTVVELGGGNSETVVNRSVFLGTREPLISCVGAEPNTERRISLIRSVLGGRGPILDLSGLPSSGGRRRSVAVQSIATSFGRFDGPGSTSPVVVPNGEGRAGEFVSWWGDYNQFSGWREWMVGEGTHTAKLANLAAVRDCWPGSDLHSQEQADPWGAAPTTDRLVPSDLESFLPELGPTLSRVASPSALLYEKTVGLFPAITLPKLATSATYNPPARGSQSATAPPTNRDESKAELAKRLGFPVYLSENRLPAATPLPKKSVTPTPAVARPADATRDVLFDLADARWQGDLGRFLGNEIRSGDKRLRIKVRGVGQRPCSPIRLPRGVSLEILPERPIAQGGAPVSWSAIPGASGAALIDVRGGDLVLSEVRLNRDGSSALKHLVRVESGHLVLNRCWLVAPGTVEAGGGGLISYKAASTQPLTNGHSPFVPSPDRFFCRVIDTLLMTGGDAISAELGRGSLALTQCAIAAGTNAITLRPAKVARDRFDAGLTLEHCTVVAERTFVSLGTWPGDGLGPNRPLVVFSRDSAFISGYDRGARDAVLLRVEPDSLDRGLLLWQSTNDAFDVFVFTGRTDSGLPSNRFADVHRQWIDLWGDSHMHAVTGATRNGSNTIFSTRLYGRLHSNNVAPGDLALDASYSPGRAKLDVGTDLSRLQILMKPPPRRRVPGPR